MFIKRMLYMFVSCFLMLSIYAIGDVKHDARERAATENKMSRIKDILQRRETKICFYGKVIDQNDKQIQGVEIELSITHYTPNPATLFGGTKKITVLTDAQGLFTIQGVRGQYLRIEDMRKKGYQFAIESNLQRGFKYSGSKGEKVFTPQEKQPVVFRLRKKGETACLSRGDFDYQFRQNDEPCYIDIIRPAFRKKSKLHVNERYGRKPIHSDVILSASVDKTQPGFLVLFAVPDTGGLIAADELFYVAPEDGYTSNIVVTVSNDKEVKKHIYVKAREGLVYGRLDISMNASSNRVSHQFSVHVRIKSLGNAYGERGLEDGTRHVLRLKEEANPGSGERLKPRQATKET